MRKARARVNGVVRAQYADSQHERTERWELLDETAEDATCGRSDAIWCMVSASCVCWMGTRESTNQRNRAEQRDTTSGRECKPASESECERSASNDEIKHGEQSERANCGWSGFWTGIRHRHRQHGHHTEWMHSRSAQRAVARPLNCLIYIR